MLANGPVCMRQGCPSSVWIRLGFSASFSRTAIAPAAPSCSAVTRSPSNVRPTVIAPSRARRSPRSRATAAMAITSEAAVMSKPVSRGTPLARPPSPTTTSRSARSLMSSARRHVTDSGSMRRGLPCSSDASSIAASRLLAAPIAWMSPVKWRLMSPIGTTCAYPPPAAPPLMPKTGPSDGSRRLSTGRRPMRPSPWVRPTAVVVLPSPAGVGFTPATQTMCACARSARRSMAPRSIFAL
jgi:hypothetical protein